MMHPTRWLASAVICLVALFAVASDAGDKKTNTTKTTKTTISSSTTSKKTKNTTFDDIKFEMEKNDDFKRKLITKEIEKLHGKKIRIRGYILPPYKQSGIKNFVLVRDNQECCFGPGAALYDCIIIDMKKGKTTKYTTRPVSVEGTFEIREWVVDDMHLAIYHLEAEVVK